MLITAFGRALWRAWSPVRVRLIHDAGLKWKRTWSLRLIELAAVSNIILNVVPVVQDYLPWRPSAETGLQLRLC